MSTGSLSTSLSWNSVTTTSICSAGAASAAAVSTPHASGAEEKVTARATAPGRAEPQRCMCGLRRGLAGGFGGP